MAVVIPSRVFGLRGQCVQQVTWNERQEALVSYCDRWFVLVAHRTGARGPVNPRLCRCVQDLPVWCRSVMLSIEYCQLKIGAADRCMERLSFVEPGHGYTRRVARFVSQLVRHTSMAAVACYTGLAWRTVKVMDERALSRELAALTGLRHRGTCRPASLIWSGT